MIAIDGKTLRAPKDTKAPIHVEEGHDAIRLWAPRLGPGMVDILHREIELIFVVLGIAAIFRAAIGQYSQELYLLARM
jgi:hypothetical protein